MSQLTKLVEFLDRDDVTEVVVATGRPVTVRVEGEYRALGRTPASLAQLDALFAGSPLAALIASGGGAAERMRLAERDCAVDVQVHGDQLMIRLSRARVPAPVLAPLADPRSRSPHSSGPVVISAAPPPPRPRTEQGPSPTVTAPASGTYPRAVEASGSGAFSRSGDGGAAGAAPPLARASDVMAVPPAGDEFGGMISRSSDGGPGAVATGERDGNGRVLTPPLTPSTGPRRKPITMPPHGGVVAAPSEAGLVERGGVPMVGGGPAASRHSIELPPGDPGAPVQVVPTATTTPTVRTTAPAATFAAAALDRSGVHPGVAPASPSPAAPAPMATPPAPVAYAPSTAAYPPPHAVATTPARRHTITAGPALEPLPPLTTAKARPTPELLAILTAARSRNASDLHLSADRPPMERGVHGLAPAGPVLAAAEVDRMLASLMSPAQRANLDARGYVDTALDVEGAGRIRANISRFRGGVKGSFRLVLSAPPTLEQLGLPRELAKVTTYHQGLVVIAGPNGHGKTTTLAALVDLINSHKAHHILTIEDPVEIQHPRKKAVISQREVGNHTRSFAAALKASLREDPDVIVIGELRDRETVEIALTAAETGHLVMATMSTPSAAKSLDRLIDMFPPDDQQQVRTSLAAALKFVVAQRLLPSADGNAVVAAVELLTGVLPLAALIRDNKLFQVASLQQRGRAFGMIRLDDSLVELARSGRISEDTALRAADNKKDFLIALRGPTAAAAAAKAPSEPGKRGLGGLFGGGRRGE